MKPIENQRLLDLVRVCRSALFIDHKLITEDEYVWLAALPSKATHQRLDDYDALRMKLQEVTRERDNWRAELKAEVEPLQAECHRRAARIKELEAALAHIERNLCDDNERERTLAQVASKVLAKPGS